jgi:hypothetical protein
MVTTQQRITKRLARLRAWCDMGGMTAEDIERETISAHNEINRLLDQLDSEGKVLQ